MKNGATVAAFEKAFAQYVGAKYAIALCNGTATLHTALVALGVRPGDKVATTPLTMSATSIAILQAGAVPVYCDVNDKTWLMKQPDGAAAGKTAVPVSLYGLHTQWLGFGIVDDAAQTLRKHPRSYGPNPAYGFTSYSFQASKILALGEGGMLVTDSEELATKAREFSSLGYRMKADQPRIDPSVLKSPDYERHHSLGWNYRMSGLVAGEVFRRINSSIRYLDQLVAVRRYNAELYAKAIEGCSWITPQYVPGGWTHDYWTFAIALESKALWKPFTDAIVRHGGEMPYGAWRLTFSEPAFRHLTPGYDAIQDGRTVRVAGCPIAEDLQPRLVQFQTNNLQSAERNAKAVRLAISEVNPNKIVTNSASFPCYIS